MSSAVAMLDLLSAAAVLASMAVLAAGRAPSLSPDSRRLFGALLAVLLFYNVSNFLQWSGAGPGADTMDRIGDFGQLLVPVLFFVLLYSLLRRRAERELEDSRERYRLLFSSGNDAVLVHEVAGDRPGRILEVNDVACRLLGYSREELLLKTPLELLAPQEPFNQSVAVTEILRRGELPFERVLLAAGGERIPVEISSHAFDLRGRPAVMSIARDVRSRRRLEEDVRQAQRMEAIGRLAGGVAHDFNNLLTVINGYCDILLERVEEGSPLRGDLEEIGAAAVKASGLTRQLLSFSRRQVLQPRMVEVNALIANMQSLLDRLLGEQVKVTFAPGPGVGAVRADPVQIEQVIVNLAINARDAMPSGGAISIRTESLVVKPYFLERQAEMAPGRYVVIVVSDTGHGMDEATVSRIFEPFFTTKPAGEGTGLGLATVYGIVRQSRGHISVDSAPGAGTTFRIFLPELPPRAAEEQG